jgi:hypothetical protein
MTEIKMTIKQLAESLGIFEIENKPIELADAVKRSKYANKRTAEESQIELQLEWKSRHVDYLKDYHKKYYLANVKPKKDALRDEKLLKRAEELRKKEELKQHNNTPTNE